MRLAFLALLVAGATYLYFHRHARAPAPPMPAQLDLPAAPVLSVEDIAKVRRSAADPDPQVRWAAVSLLLALKDPEIGGVVDKLVAQDPDPELRRRALELLKNADNVAVLPPLIRGLKDAEKSVRIAALRSLGEIGDPAAIPWVTESLKDYEPDVKIEAIRTLDRFEEKRKAAFQAVAAKLRHDYDQAVANSKKGLFSSQPPETPRVK